MWVEVGGGEGGGGSGRRSRPLHSRSMHTDERQLLNTAVACNTGERLNERYLGTSMVDAECTPWYLHGASQQVSTTAEYEYSCTLLGELGMASTCCLYSHSTAVSTKKRSMVSTGSSQLSKLRHDYCCTGTIYAQVPTAASTVYATSAH